MSKRRRARKPKTTIQLRSQGDPLLDVVDGRCAIIDGEWGIAVFDLDAETRVRVEIRRPLKGGTPYLQIHCSAWGQAISVIPAQRNEIYVGIVKDR